MWRILLNRAHFKIVIQQIASTLWNLVWNPNRNSENNNSIEVQDKKKDLSVFEELPNIAQVVHIGEEVGVHEED